MPIVNDSNRSKLSPTVEAREFIVRRNEEVTESGRKCKNDSNISIYIYRSRYRLTDGDRRGLDGLCEGSGGRFNMGKEGSQRFAERRELSLHRLAQSLAGEKKKREIKRREKTVLILGYIWCSDHI